jgi:hypothetical protein
MFFLRSLPIPKKLLFDSSFEVRSYIDISNN